MRFPVPRLTFLGRFTLVMIAVTLLSAIVLAATMERAHRTAIETDVEVSVLSHLSAELSEPLAALTSTGHPTAATRHAFERIGDDARLFEYVTALRIYTHDGAPVFPPNAPRSRGKRR